MSSVDDLAWHLADRDDTRPAGASREGAPVGLSEAVAERVVPMTLAALRKARERDPRFPRHVAVRRGERVYERGDLIDWHTRRAEPEPAAHGLDASRPAPRAAGPTKREREQLAQAAKVDAHRDQLAAWWQQLAEHADNTASDLDLLGIAGPADPGDGGTPCPKCSEPMRWAGGYTALVCVTPAGRVHSWARDGKALERAAVLRARRAPKATAAAGPSPAEREEVAEQRAVALDELAGIREQLAAIPRGDDYRADAVRALHKLGNLEQLYKDAGSLEALADAELTGVDLLGDADNDGELAELLDHADQLARQLARAERKQTRQDSGGGILRALLGSGERGEQLELLADDGEVYDGEIVDDEQYAEAIADDGDQAPELDSGEHLALPIGQGIRLFAPRPRRPDLPNWRGNAVAQPSPAVQPTPERAALELRYGCPPCEQCLDGGNRQPPPAVARVIYNNVRAWDVCAEHGESMQRGAARVQVIGIYDQRRAIAVGRQQP